MKSVAMASVVLIVCSTTVLADDDLQEQRETFVVEQFEETVREIALQQLNILIDDLDLALKLESKDRKRLQLAAKGTAAKYAAKQIEKDKHIIERQMRDNLPNDARFLALNSELIDVRRFRVEDDAKDEADVLVEDAGEEPMDVPDVKDVFPKVSFRFRQTTCGWSFRKKNSSSGYGVAGGFKALVATEPWARSFGEIVTAEQRQEYEAFKRKRADKAITDMLMGYLDLHLRLSPEQRPRIRSWLEPQIKIGEVTHLGDYGQLFTQRARALNSDGLDRILSSNQMVVWDSLQASQ